jgi:ATP-binding cassette subfamily C (CFTR/MRP) protein 1
MNHNINKFTKIENDDEINEIPLNDDQFDEQIIENSDSNNSEKKYCGISSISNLWETVTFAWIQPLLKLGNTRALETADLFDLLENDRSEVVYNKFLKSWNKEKQISNMNSSDKIAPKPSLTYSLITAFGYPFLCAGILKFTNDSCQFVGPVLLNYLINFLSDPTQPSYLGYTYVCILFVSNVLMSLCLRQYFWWCYRVGLRLRTSVITSVYNKALIIATSALNKKTSGEITNLMSVDSTRLQVIK